MSAEDSRRRKVFIRVGSFQNPEDRQEYSRNVVGEAK